MTQPSIVRDADGSKWHLQSDGTYNLKSASDFLTSLYQGYSLDKIRDEFGVIGLTFDTPQGERDYSHLRRGKR